LNSELAQLEAGLSGTYLLEVPLSRNIAIGS